MLMLERIILYSCSWGWT